ncbi:MAG: hypothetical protein OZ935_13315 [Pseudomonadota bacterium]|nr:hypothetical protein [Pseudomonadota bacterium]
MEPEYFEYVEEDAELYDVVESMLPALRALSAEQVETLVFYLKSLHSYYPSSENHTANRERFDEALKTIRESAEQKALQRVASMKLFKAMATSVAAGAIIALGAVVLAGNTSWGTALIATAVGLFILAEARYGIAALDAAKEQDRRYFLQCIRTARGCNELDWSGLFTYNGVTQPGTQSDAAIERTRLRIAELSAQLRRALYNDEYMHYSTKR